MPPLRSPSLSCTGCCRLPTRRWRSRGFWPVIDWPSATFPWASWCGGFRVSIGVGRPLPISAAGRSCCKQGPPIARPWCFRPAARPRNGSPTKSNSPEQRLRRIHTRIGTCWPGRTLAVAREWLYSSCSTWPRISPSGYCAVWMLR